MINLKVENTPLFVKSLSTWVDEIKAVYDDETFIGFVWFYHWHFGISYTKDNIQMNVWPLNTLHDALVALVQEIPCGHLRGGKTQANAH